MNEIHVSASREGFHCSHCGWLVKVDSDEPNREHQDDCPWLKFEARAKGKCSTCGGAGWTTEPHPASGEPMEVQCQECGVASEEREVDPLAQYEWARDFQGTIEAVEPRATMLALATRGLAPTMGVLHGHFVRSWYRDVVEEHLKKGKWVRWATSLSGLRPETGERGFVDTGGYLRGSSHLPAVTPVYWSLGDDKEMLVFVVPLEDEPSREELKAEIRRVADSIDAKVVELSEPRADTTGFLEHAERFVEKLGVPLRSDGQEERHQPVLDRLMEKWHDPQYPWSSHDEDELKALREWIEDRRTEFGRKRPPRVPREPDIAGWYEEGAAMMVSYLEGMRDAGAKLDPADCLREVALYHPYPGPEPEKDNRYNGSDMQPSAPEPPALALPDVVGTWCDDPKCPWTPYNKAHWHCVEECGQVMFKGTLDCDRASKCRGVQPA